MSEPKRWIIVEMRNGNVHNLLIDAAFEISTAGDWLPYYRKVSTGEIKQQAHAERGLNTPRAITGEETPTFGPILQPIEGVGVYSEDRKIRISDIVDWSEATEYWNGVCDQAWEQDMKAWKSALKKGPRIVTASAGVLDTIGKIPANGQAPFLKLPE